MKSSVLVNAAMLSTPFVKTANSRELKPVLDKILGFLNKTERRKNVATKVLNYRPLATENQARQTSIGALLGGATGYTGASEDGNHRTLAALMGAAGGAGAGRYGPHVMQRALGRVTTNLVRPWSYDLKEHVDVWRKMTLRDAIRSVVRDEPLWYHHLSKESPKRYVGPNQVGNYRKYWDSGELNPRFLLWRDVFGMKPWSDHTSNAVTRIGDHGGSKLYRLNTHDPIGAREAKTIDANLRRDSRWYDGIPYAQQPRGLSSAPTPANFSFDRRTGDWYDDWDLGMNAGEKVLSSPQNLARALLSMWATPPRLIGKVNLTASERAR